MRTRKEKKGITVSAWSVYEDKKEEKKGKLVSAWKGRRANSVCSLSSKKLKRLEYKTF
jgi:hypothetical protein